MKTQPSHGLILALATSLLAASCSGGSSTSAPASRSRSAWATAASAVKNSPPSLNESRVTLTMPKMPGGFMPHHHRVKRLRTHDSQRPQGASPPS